MFFLNTNCRKAGAQAGGVRLSKGVSCRAAHRNRIERTVWRWVARCLSKREEIPDLAVSAEMADEQQIIMSLDKVGHLAEDGRVDIAAGAIGRPAFCQGRSVGGSAGVPGTARPVAAYH